MNGVKSDKRSDRKSKLLNRFGFPESAVFLAIANPHRHKADQKKIPLVARELVNRC
ncbi:MAG: hypothetical protein KGI97_05860 [Alphaproteobacteria bacterium]|nr:hypothetical protein [Alphaproteobacteria bacterium]